MENEEKKTTQQPLAEEELDGVSGGNGSNTKTQTAVCSACNQIVLIAAPQLPSFGRCPRCGKEAYFNPIGYKFG